MNITNRRRFIGASIALAAGLASLAPTAATAQANFPSQPIRLVVPYPAGGATDTLARIIGGKLQDSWGITVVVENKPGASGIIGTQTVLRSPADGYTVLVGVTSLIQQPPMMDKLPYDPLKDLTPVVLTARTSNVFVVPLSSPITSMKEFVAQAKANPARFNFGSWGNGSSAHIHGALLNQQTGMDLTHIPFQGSAPMITNLVGGQIASAFIDIPSARPHFNSMRVLAVTGPQRLPELPGVPTFTELGYQNFEPRGWHGMFVPAGTPAPVVAKLSAEINRILRLPDVLAKIDGLGMTVGGGTPEEFAQTLRTDAGVYARIIKAANIRLNQ